MHFWLRTVQFAAKLDLGQDLLAFDGIEELRVLKCDHGGLVAALLDHGKGRMRALILWDFENLLIIFSFSVVCFFFAGRVGISRIFLPV